MEGIWSEGFAERVHINQSRLLSEMKSQYDFIICGSGSSGSVVARRLAENPEVSVLLVEAGGEDNVPGVTEPGKWFQNLGSERDWNFRAEPSSFLNGRAIPMNMGKVLGGGSSINVMAWMRGHRTDWDFFAAETGDPAWSYESILSVYRRIEDWRGAPDPARRGVGGPVFVQPVRDPHPIVPATVEAARSVGIPTFDSPNGRMMEGAGGCSVMDVLIRNGRRQSVFRAYTFPYMDRPNLTVLTQTQVLKVTFEGSQATGVELVQAGRRFHIGAEREVVLSLGAINTPKVLMHSGIGDQSALRALGIPLIQHLPGVGQNFQDHAGIGCVWEHPDLPPPRNNAAEVTFFWKSDSSLETPDLQTCQGEIPIPSIETAAQFAPPAKSWTMLAGVVRPKSRGRVYLSGPDPDDPVRIEANLLSHPDDIRAARAGVELCREVGNSHALRSFARREVMPGNLKGLELHTFIRNGAISYWHQSGTAAMGRDAMSVVDGELRVFGLKNLRIADASIMPRVTTGNTMAACVVIGERAAELLKIAHRI
ncbi:MAG: choline dehydrogenase [Rhodospirillaceae bacterium]|nr:choline dehydrogenase [Rhodospirillaceae bacterium]